MPRSSQPGSSASVRAAGLVLTLFATAAGAAGAAQLTPAPLPDATPTVAPPPPLTELDAHLDAHARRLDLERWNRALASQQEVARFESLVSAQRDAELDAQRVAMWDELAHCETGGNWYDGGQYGGGLGIYVGTWRMYGGNEFAAKPQWATKGQQIEVAERIARDGYGGWGCARRIGLVD